MAGDGVMGSGAEAEAAVAASKIARARRGSRSARTRRWRWSAVRVFGHLGGVGLAGGMGAVVRRRPREVFDGMPRSARMRGQG